MSGPGSGGLPPIRRRGVASTPDRTTRPRAGVSGWDDVAGPPGGGRPGGRDPGGWGTAGATPVRLERPNLPLIVGLAGLTLLTVALVLRGTQPLLGAAIVTGMFVGVVLLGLARLDANGKRSGGRFADWRVESVRIATLLFVIGWGAGLVSLWRFALLVSRRFT